LAQINSIDETKIKTPMAIEQGFSCSRIRLYNDQELLYNLRGDMVKELNENWIFDWLNTGENKE